MNEESKITLEELSEHAPHPVKMYEHLIDHVQGFGDHGWYQETWFVDRARGIGLPTWEGCLSEALKRERAVAVEGCDAYACVAGEAALFAGVTYDPKSGLMFDGATIVDAEGALAGWSEVAEALGVPNTIEGERQNLFSSVNTRDVVLQQLEHRRISVLAGEAS